jgi:DNA polymerase I-like protein with 3'-5' exonuclease and polymerase domains
MVIYSRDFINKGEHKKIFNLGYNSRGKPLYRPQMTPTAFVKAVRRTTKVAKKTRAEHCHTCNGKGRYVKTKVNGEPYKKDSKCVLCDGRGYLLIQTKETAGLGMVPKGVKDVCIHGFSTSKQTIKDLIRIAKEEGKETAVEFLEGYMRLNAISTYLDSFVNGIETWTRDDGLLHAQFNQCRTKTGRLSSSNPNFQNQPKGGKFPVRKCVVSRFDGGSIIEADFSGLEFRVAGELSRDPQIIKDILDGKDVHKQTASIINRKPPEEITKEERQSAKAYTFAPLYGGMGAGEPPHIQTYFNEYFNIYKGLKGWHDILISGVLKDTLITIPSGRQFSFPDVKRFKNGSVSNATQIKNFPVQSFATADIVPLSCVRALRKMKGLQSKIILTVHDSIVVDCAPEEMDEVLSILKWAMYSVGEELESRYNYTPVLPLDIEIQVGQNWLDLKEINFDEIA